MACYPPSAGVLEDMSSLDDVSTCSSTSTITCSVWSSMSTMDRSSIRQMSSLTFSGMLEDEEYDYLVGRGGDSADIGAADDARKSCLKYADKACARSNKTTADPLVLHLSERSLFQEPPSSSPICWNRAPKAPTRSTQSEDDGSTKGEDVVPSRPLFTKSSSCPSRVGNVIYTATTSCSGQRGPGLNRGSSFPLRGVDLKPEIPTRSSKDWNDDSSGVTFDGASRDANLVEKTPRARRKQLMKRIDHIDRMLENDDCNLSKRGSMSRFREEPPKLPKRGLFIETQATDHPSRAALSSPRSHSQSVLQTKHGSTTEEEVWKLESKNHGGALDYLSNDKKSRSLASNLPPTKPRRKKRMTISNDDCDVARACNTLSKKHTNKEAPEGETPSLLSKSKRDIQTRRSLSETPPKRRATTLAAALHYITDAEKYPIAKRIIKRNRSSEHHRRRGQVLSNSSLASILEIDDENVVASSSNNSPLRRGPMSLETPVVWCPSSGIGIEEASELHSKKGEELGTTKSGVGDKFIGRPQRTTRKRTSWLGSGSRSLLL